MSLNRITKYHRTLPKGPNNRNMCRNKCGKEVQKPRRTFCSDSCVHQYRVKSDVTYMRLYVFQRDLGICALCSLDTVIAHQMYLRSLKSASWGQQEALKKENKALGWPKRNSWWEADHILPVCKGGGECGLENIRTLCCPCHKKETKKLKKCRD